MTSLDSEGFRGGTEVVFENTNFWFTIGIASFSPPAKETSRSPSPEISPQSEVLSLNCPMPMQWASPASHPRQSPSLTAPTPSPPDEIPETCLNSQVRDCFSLSLLLLYCARRICFTPRPVFITNTLFWSLSELLRVDYIISKQWLFYVPKASSDWYVVEYW